MRKNRARAFVAVSDHCKLECPDYHTKNCTRTCFTRLLNRVEEIMDERDKAQREVQDG